MREFFGFGGYTRSAEGYLSWQHLLFVTTLVVIMAALAVFLGNRNKNRSDKEKNKVLIFAAVLINAIEIFKIVMISLRSGDALSFLHSLPLFLCSIQLIAIPLAAFSRGRVKEAALDFVCIFGLLGAILGTYAAGNNYSCYPVLSIDNVASGLTHVISGFASIYVTITKMASLKKKNIGITFAILTAFCILAYVANVALDYNYMFLMRGDGTPYDIVFDLTGGSKILYPISVVALFFIYIQIYYFLFYAVQKKKACEKKSVPSNDMAI